jgi:hypothetical protein
MCSGLNKAAVDLEAEAKAACPVGTGVSEARGKLGLFQQWVP